MQSGSTFHTFFWVDLTPLFGFSWGFWCSFDVLLLMLSCTQCAKPVWEQVLSFGCHFVRFNLSKDLMPSFAFINEKLKLKPFSAAANEKLLHKLIGFRNCYDYKVKWCQWFDCGSTIVRGKADSNGNGNGNGNRTGNWLCVRLTHTHTYKQKFICSLMDALSKCISIYMCIYIYVITERGCIVNIINMYMCL